MDDATFVDLLARARRGEEEAARSLLREFEPDVRLMVRARLPRALRSQFDTMDFAQAAWTSFFADRDPPPLENPAHLRAFLSGVVRNKVFEEYRRRTRSKKYDIGREESLFVRRGPRDRPVEVAASGPTPSQELQAEDRFDQIVAGRPEDEAEAMRLRREGLTLGEIAERTGIAERTVRRMFKSLRERMEERGWL